MDMRLLPMLIALAIGSPVFVGVDLADAGDIDPFNVPGLPVQRGLLPLLAPAEPQYRYRRSRRSAAKPKRKPNRLHVSRRTRRKHRRAA